MNDTTTTTSNLLSIIFLALEFYVPSGAILFLQGVFERSGEKRSVPQFLNSESHHYSTAKLKRSSAYTHAGLPAQRHLQRLCPDVFRLRTRIDNHTVCSL